MLTVKLLGLTVGQILVRVAGKKGTNLSVVAEI